MSNVVKKVVLLILQGVIDLDILFVFKYISANSDSVLYPNDTKHSIKLQQPNNKNLAHFHDFGSCKMDSSLTKN